MDVKSAGQGEVTSELHFFSVGDNLPSSVSLVFLYRGPFLALQVH